MSDNASQSNGPRSSRRTVLAMAIQISIGLGLGAGAGISPAGTVPTQNTASVTLTEFSRDKTTFDSGFHRGLNRADIPVSGISDAADGAVIEARLVAYHDKTDVATGFATPWADVATLGMGTGLWFGVVSGPRNVGTEYRAQARVKGSSAPAAQMTNRCRVGHVWALWEQSNYERLWYAVSDASLFDAFINGGAYEGDVQFVGRQSGDPVNGYSAVSIDSSTTGVGQSPGSPSMVAVANAFSSARPGEKLMFVAQTKQGSGLRAALSSTAEFDAGSYSGLASGFTRNYSTDYGIHLSAIADGSKIGAVIVPGWYESNAPIQALIQTHINGFLGKEMDGSKISIATRDIPRVAVRTYPDGSHGDLDGFDLRNAYDPNGDASPKTGGIYDMDYSVFLFLGPHNETKSMGSLPPAASVTGIGDLRYDTAGATPYRGMVQNAKQRFDPANPLFPETLKYPGTTHGAFLDAGDTTHYFHGNVDGQVRLMKICIFHILGMAGLHSYPNPVLDFRYDPLGADIGQYADFGMVGHDMTTERLRRGDPAIAQIGATGSNLDPNTGDATPHRTEVMGWGINAVAAERAVIHTVTQTDIDNGHTAPLGRKVCRVYAPTGESITWETGLEYCPDNQSHILVQEDYAAETWKNLLVADVGQAAAAPAFLPGQPVQVGLFTMPAPTLAVPDLFKVSDSGWWTDNGAYPRSHDKAFIEVKLRPDKISSQLPTRIAAIGTDVFIDITTAGAAKITYGALSAKTADGIFVAGKFTGLQCTVDRSAGDPKLAILSESGATLASVAIPADGNFGTGRVIFFYAPLGHPGSHADLEATVVYCKVYLGQLDGTGDPDYGFVGDASADGVAIFGEANMAFTGTTPITPADL